MEKQLQVGTAAQASQVNMGMTVMKEIGAKWLTGLYDKLRAEPSIVVNGFKNVGIVEAVKKARENPLSIESNENNLPPSEEDKDPFDSRSEDEDHALITLA